MRGADRSGFLGAVHCGSSPVNGRRGDGLGNRPWPRNVAFSRGRRVAPPPDLSVPPNILRAQGYGHTWSWEARKESRKPRFLRDEPSLISDPALYAANLSTDDERRDHHRESRHRVRWLGLRQQQLRRSRREQTPSEESAQPPVQFSVDCPDLRSAMTSDAWSRNASSGPTLGQPFENGQEDPDLVYTNNHPELLNPTPRGTAPPGTAFRVGRCGTG